MPETQATAFQLVLSAEDRSAGVQCLADVIRTALSEDPQTTPDALKAMAESAARAFAAGLTALVAPAEHAGSGNGSHADAKAWAAAAKAAVDRLALPVTGAKPCIP